MTVTDLDNQAAEALMRFYGAKTKAEAVRRAIDETVRRHKRMALMEAIDSGEIDLTHDARAA
ncbi:type II toxin-antitoxin system VapB family antitoxin [Streptomyces sp. SM14]|uniref:type II toxin-antitoxin system VapB family antitoxin n=1 Tax=Streptomyces sp. SM14 TaxID=1736045 RepID=UPI00215608C2|nr:type II toxin-antitoxin system VapB family antitoxin [Streptomyces sp. SM14]